MLPTKEHLQNALATVKPHTHRTPVLQSSQLNQMSGADLYFKCENFQKMGAFKMRGALCKIASLSTAEQQNGVVTHSSGNFGQAVALAARNLGITAYVVMPENAPRVKIEAVKGYGGIVTTCTPTIAAREAATDKIQKATGATALHPSNDLHVILGNATAGIELLEAQPDLDFVLAPVGGGGLIAGTALAAHYYGRQCTVIGGEPKEADDAYRSLELGSIVTNTSTDTIADGLRTHLGDINFPIIQALVSEIIRVEEHEIVAALQLIWERLKIIVEPSCAVPFAAVLKAPKQFKGKKVGIILSGGNIDVHNLPF